MAEEGLAYDRRQGVTHERRRGLAHDRLQGLTNLTGSRMTRPHSLGKQIQIKVVTGQKGRHQRRQGVIAISRQKKHLAVVWVQHGFTDGKVSRRGRQGLTGGRVPHLKESILFAKEA